jgi:hypothetical protein
VIDDAVLEDLLSRTADAVPVPDQGAAEVLAARRFWSQEAAETGRRVVRPRAGRGWSRRTGALVAAAVLVGAVGLSVAVEQGGSSSHVASSASTVAGADNGALVHGSVAVGPGTAGAPATSGSAAAGSSGLAAAPAASPQSSSAPAPSTPSSPDQVPAVQTRVIKTASASLSIPRGRLQTVMGQLGDVASTDGGYVQSSTTSSSSPGQPATGNATLRIPVDNFETALDRVKALGTPTSVTSSGQDVTSQYVDLQARLQSLEDSRTQFRQILTHATSISDILAVEQQIGDIQTQIEQLQGQLNVMSDQTAYSTITVSLSEAPTTTAVKPPPAPPSGLSKAWAHARHSFAHGLEAVVAASGGFAVFLICAGAALLLGRLAWTRTRRRLL